MAEDPERRADDRRNTVDLNRPAYRERREVGTGRRPGDQRLAKDIQSLPRVDFAAADFTQPIDPTKTVAELQADFALIEAGLQERLQAMQGLPEAEFEAAQARDEVSLVACAAQLERLRTEIQARSASD